MPTSNSSTGSALIHNTMKRLSPNFDIEALELVCASVLAHSGDGSPAWLSLNGAPSSGKTFILDALPTVPIPSGQSNPINEGILVVDSLTAHTLISGLANATKPGLLERINSAILVVKDLSPLATGGASRQVFSQLRRVFDGELALPFGSSKVVEWKGRLTLICASTAHLWSLDAELGGRLLVVTMRPTAYSSLLANGRAELRMTLDKILQMNLKPQVTSFMSDTVRPYAEAISIVRAYVRRDRSDRDVTDLPSVEQPHRLTNQLSALTAGLCVLRDSTLQDTMQALLRVTVDTIPPYRRAVLAAIANQRGGVPLEDLVKDVRTRTTYKVSPTTVRRVIEDLALLNLIDDEHTAKTGTSGQPPKLIERGTRWQIIADAPGLEDALRLWTL